MRHFSMILCALLITVSPCLAEDWAGFLGPWQTGVSYDEVVQKFPDSGAKVLWRKDLGEGFGSAAIVGDEVFVLDRVDSLRDVLRCLNLADGKEKWSCGYESPGKFSFNGSRSTPAVDDKCVYTVGPHGEFTAFSRKTHKILWQKKLVSEFDAKKPRWVVSQSPLIYKDMVIVAPQGQKASLAAYQRESGKLIWQAKPVGSGMNYASVTYMDLCGTEQLVALCGAGDGTVLAGFEPKTGKVLWQYDQWHGRNPIPNPIPLDGDRIFITGGYGKGSVIIQVSKYGDKFTTETLHKMESFGAQIATPIVIDGFIILNCNTNKSKTGLACLNETGEMMWNTGTVGPASFDRGNIVYVGDKLFILDKSGFLRMISPDPYRYTEVSCVRIFDDGKNAWSPMAVSKGKMVLRNYKQMACIAIDPESYE